MNTETLRALLTKLGKSAKQATADEVLDKTFLTGIVAGNPFAAGPATDWHTDPKNAKATRPADKAAQAVGYADYDAYQKSWVKNVTFLDVSLGEGKSEPIAHPYLVSRLKVAEDFLINLHGSKEAALKATKWDQKGGLSYEFDDTHVDGGMSHQHTMGLAIDISPGVNPWIYRNGNVKGVDQNQKYDDHFAIAARLFGGPAVTSARLNDWSRTGSTEELHGNVDGASNHINQYMRFSQKHAKKTETDIQEIRTFMESKGFKPEEATEEKAKFVADFAAWFHGAGGQSGANELTNISMDMLVALRDVAGLSWGGTEMGGAENGDFMHFDCRNTEFGNAVVKQMSPDEQKKAAEAEKAKSAKPKKK